MTNQKDNIDVKIALSLEKLMQVQRILLWEVAKKENLSPIQIQILIFINSHKDDLCKISILANEFDLTKATVSDAVSNLENKGLINKTRLENDKRSYVLQLSAAAKKLIKKINNWQSDLISQIGKFPTKEKEIALGFFTQLIKHLFDNKIISIARMCLTCENIIIGSSTEPHVCKLTGRNFYNDSIEIDCANYTSSKSE